MSFLPYYDFHVKVGGAYQGPDSRFGFRFSWCSVGDLCNIRNVKNAFLWQLLEGWMYKDMKKFREAMTKKEQCKVDLLSMWGSKQPIIEKMRKEYHEYCPKSKSNNIIFCPKCES